MFDNTLLFSDEQAITATALGTNAVDLGHTEIIGNQPIVVGVRVTEKFAGAGNLSIQVHDSATETGTYVSYVSTVAVDYADLEVGDIIYVTLPVIPQLRTKRWLKLNYVIAGGSATAGKVSSGITFGICQAD